MSTTTLLIHLLMIILGNAATPFHWMGSGNWLIPMWEITSFYSQ